MDLGDNFKRSEELTLLKELEGIIKEQGIFAYYLHLLIMAFWGKLARPWCCETDYWASGTFNLIRQSCYLFSEFLDHLSKAVAERVFVFGKGSKIT